MNIVIQKSSAKSFAEELTRSNMHRYYEMYSMQWDSARFDQSWVEFENYEIIVNGLPVGVLRIRFDGSACYVQDLQIKPSMQNIGIGTDAILKLFDIAKNRNINNIRLRVFEDNPAIHLYEKLGFKVVRVEQSLVSMEAIVV